MNIKYNILGDISTQHAYHETGIAQGFRFSSLFDTPKLLKQNSIKLRSLMGGSKIELYINDAYADQAAKSWSKNPVHLFFALDFTDPYFLSYTDLPLRSPLIPKQITINGAQEVYFFSNTGSALDKNTITDKTDRILLLPPSFNITYSSADVSGDKIIIRKSTTTDSIVEIPFDTSASDSENKSLSVQLSDEDFQIEGLYEIVIENLDPIPFKYVPILLKGVHWGLLQLTLGSAGEHTPFTNTDSGDPVLKTESYFINFANRAVKWQYNIISDQHNADDFDILSIDLNQEGKSRNEILSNLSAFAQHGIPHQKGEVKILPNGQKAIPILLEEAILLSEKQEKAFILKVNKSENEPISIVLPIASGNTPLQPLSKDNADEAYLTDIYVYL